ncbi:MAG: radical SAM protein, partial [Bacteroidetes bacterium]|nr:radical SAM protein [Bacteroidota bacterium]
SSNSLISLGSADKLVKASLINERIDFTPYRERGVYSIQTKRGCHHQCIYCTYPIIEGCNYRLRTAVDIVNEIENAHKSLGNITFEFVDSTFNDPAGHAEAICKEIIKRNLKINLRTMGINPAHISKELLHLMLNAGFMQIDSTPDSASPKIVKILKKNFSIQQLENTASLIRESDIPTMWFFLFGSPQESIETVNETFDFIAKYINPDDMVHMTVGLRIYPNTELQRIAIEEKVIKAEDSLLKPTFYVSDKIGKDALDEAIKKFSLEFSNCIPASESTPSKEMMQIAMKMRKEENLQEPMFRTLMKVKRLMK